MANDEHGLPVPGESSPLPWSTNEHRDEQANERRVDDHDGVRVAGVWDDEDANFIVHAANNIIECREIVRRLAEWHDDGSPIRDVMKISGDASRLWAKMKQEAGDGK